MKSPGLAVSVGRVIRPEVPATVATEVPAIREDGADGAASGAEAGEQIGGRQFPETSPNRAPKKSWFSADSMIGP